MKKAYKYFIKIMKSGKPLKKIANNITHDILATAKYLETLKISLIRYIYSQNLYPQNHLLNIEVVII